MRLFPSFWDGAFVAVDSQCQVQIFCHELAHLAAGADDVSGDDETCYGMGGVRRAKANGVSACNAENLAMFALRFHPELAHLLPPRSRPPQ
jgi:hypothetical protein